MKTVDRDSHIMKMDSRKFEIVERKGDGHPDTICDTVVNACAKALAKEYLNQYGEPQHYNLDKAFLIAGQSEPKFNQATNLLKPMRFLIGDRATVLRDAQTVEDLIIDCASEEMLKFRYVGIEDFIIEPVARQGSTHLRSVYDNKRRIGANDTSATIGYAPLSKTELLVHTVENVIRTLRQREKALGDDVKIMAVRNDKDIDLTVAIAMVAQELDDISDYKEVINWTQGIIIETLRDWNLARVKINALDDFKKGSVYITETGLSAEGADSGQVGRGNNPMGVIPLCRPASAEAEAGKNGDSHVGKIYNRLAFDIADEIYQATGYENYVWLVSQIGMLVNNPLYARVEFCEGSSATNSSLYTAEKILEDSIRNWKDIELF